MPNRLEAAAKTKDQVLIHDMKGQFRRVAWLEAHGDGRRDLCAVLLRAERTMTVHSFSDGKPVELMMYARAREMIVQNIDPRLSDAMLQGIAEQKLQSMQDQAEAVMREAQDLDPIMPLGPRQASLEINA